jgi:hypothetical protein
VAGARSPAPRGGKQSTTELLRVFGCSKLIEWRIVIPQHSSGA